MTGRAHRKNMLTLFLFASSFIVIYAIANHFSLMYSIVLIEIISFIFIGVATKERGEKSIKSIMTKESVVAYLIPSLFSQTRGSEAFWSMSPYVISVVKIFKTKRS